MTMTISEMFVLANAQAQIGVLAFWLDITGAGTVLIASACVFAGVAIVRGVAALIRTAGE